MVERRTLKRCLLAAMAALFCTAMAGTATAQSSTPPLTVEEIRVCTCQKQYIDALRPEMEARQAIREDRERALRLLEAEITQMQAAMDPNDLAMQEQLKSRIYQANHLRDQIRRDFYFETTRDFNAAVRSYNENCANRRMIAVDIAAANEGLSCPPVPQP
jgi:hypothetical protein